MTLISLPDFVAMLILMGILGRLMNLHPGRRVEPWLWGLTFTLVETIASSVSGGSPPWRNGLRVASLDASVLAAATFTWAARGRVWSRSGRLPIFFLPAVPLLALGTLFGMGKRGLAAYEWITGASLALGLVYIALIWSRRRPALLKVCAIHLCLWLPLFVFARSDRLADMMAWGLCWVYLLTAFSFRRLMHRGRLGGIVIVAGFLVWAACFAMAPWLRGMPSYAPVLDEVRDMQKFFVTIGMLLVLLEEQTERSEAQALTDSLTGLPNRRLFDDRLVHAIEHARRVSTPLGLFVVDLNGFKEINDSCGHATGDAALRHTALQLKARIRSSDTVARIGGDEFCVLMPEVGQGACDHVAQSLREAVQRVPLPEGCPGPLTASIGYALFPVDGNDGEALRNLADARMYEEKRMYTTAHVRYRLPYEASRSVPEK